MKKHFILGIMALAALASCDKSEVLNQESLKEKGIKFSTYVGKSTSTKAETIYGSNVKDAGIGVMAWRTGSADIVENDLDSYAPEFMDNILLVWDGTNGTYAPERYWPSTGAKVSFFAYAPYITSNPDHIQPDNGLYHPENITFNEGGLGAHVLTLTVPNDPTGVEFENHTDFMVAKVGNGVEDNGTWTGETAEGVKVGINQNLNKDYDGKVELQMKHALSKISFVAKSVDNNVAQDEPYSDGLVKVVFDEIELVGNFANSGSYNLFTEVWKIDNQNNNLHNSYKLVNTDGTENDPFTAMADEVYNSADYEKVAENSDWFKLNKTSHDMMIIPFVAETTPAQITNVKGSYTVKTYAQQKETVLVGGANVEKLVYLDANGARTYDATRTEQDAEGNTVTINNKPAVGNEIVTYRDKVTFGVDEDGNDVPFTTPIDLLPGKAYVFQFNIKLKKIEFNVEVGEWDEANNSHSIVDTEN